LKPKVEPKVEPKPVEEQAAKAAAPLAFEAVYFDLTNPTCARTPATYSIKNAEVLKSQC